MPGFGHIFSPDSLTRTLLRQGRVLKQLLVWEKWREHTFQGRGDSKEPPLAHSAPQSRPLYDLFQHLPTHIQVPLSFICFSFFYSNVTLVVHFLTVKNPSDHIFRPMPSGYRKFHNFNYLSVSSSPVTISVA